MEKYLEEIFSKKFTGIKDDFETAFDNWLLQLDVQEVIDYADVYADEQFRAGLESQRDSGDFTGSTNEGR